MARQKRLCSSITFRNLSLRPAAVALNWKTMAHTWWGCSPRWRLTDPSEGRARLRFLGAPPPGRRGAQTPGTAPAGPQQPCRSARCALQRNDAPGSEVSRRTARCASRRNKILEHHFLQLRFCQKILEPGVLLLQLRQPPGLLGLHAPVLLPPAVIGRLRHLDHSADVGHGLAWAISCSAVLSLRMICSAVCLVRFMLVSPAQSGRLKTLIHPGPVSGGHDRCLSTPLPMPS